METSLHFYSSPVGVLEIRANERAVTGVNLIDKHTDLLQTQPHEYPNELIKETCRQLDEYFAGTRKQFELLLDPWGTAFQQEVWNGLLKIPYGTTVSYIQLAQAINRPKACRAVGSANGKNPISIIIPCHRVIAADGGLGGYACGLEMKKWLLDLEMPKK